MSVELAEQTTTPMAICRDDQKDVLRLYSKIKKSKAKLVGPDGKSHNLPESLYKFLVQLVLDLNEGKSVSIFQRDAAMTTVEAANLLGVSRQYLVKLLEREAIPHSKVGTHRRVLVRDVLAFKSKRDASRRKALDELARAETDEGTYDLTSSDAEAHQSVHSGS
jgi:excisionase family DNA binding protein